MFILDIRVEKKFCMILISHLGRGKTYALVGPTGGGKTTTASLIARLYDPVTGEVVLDGKDIRAYEPAERAENWIYFAGTLSLLPEPCGKIFYMAMNHTKIIQTDNWKK